MHCQSQGHTTEDKARHVVEDEVEEKRKEKVQRQLYFFGGVFRGTPASLAF